MKYLFWLFFIPASLPAQTSYDLLLRSGTVIDGTGKKRYAADVAVQDGKIAAIGKLNPEDARQVIDIQGLIIAPGFIDVHTHIEKHIFTLPTADNYLYDGVTTVVTGNCGFSKVNLKEFFEKIEEKGSSLNIASLIGHNDLRRVVMGDSARDPRPEELEKMREIVERAMQNGAAGLSTGLIYIPGTYTKTPEIVELAKIAAKYKGIYASHIRNEGDQVLEAINEALSVGREAKIPVEISHFKASGRQNFGRSREMVSLVEKSRKTGQDVLIDQYPYTASSTNLGAMIPSWALADGDSAVKIRLTDSLQKNKIKNEMIDIFRKRKVEHLTYAVVAQYDSNSTFNGKNLMQITEIRTQKPSQLNEEVETIFAMILKGGAQMVYHSMDETDVERIMQYKNTMIASDGGVVPMGLGVPHPRAYGTNARVLQKYVRERKIIMLEEAIRKMTSLPARRFNFKNRGEIKVGNTADLVVFDEKTVAEKSTYDQPHAYTTGISFVIVNGVPVVENGKHNGLKPGKVLRNR
jgi:N-acyl-D-amino-acid deacylase